ncbi:MAG: hypothetical protein ACJ72X_03935 [Nitrososphaeraceae archaeon]
MSREIKQSKCSYGNKWKTTRSRSKYNIANFVSFVDYLAGRKSGFYFLSLAAPYQKEEDDTTITRRSIIQIL